MCEWVNEKSDSEKETEVEGPMIEIDINNINLNDVTIMNDDDLNDDMIWMKAKFVYFFFPNNRYFYFY
jgi:hypothetical protein